ncbi:YkgJ family cysteine cluster protein [Desulfospira joergensenii]|uniref:YkgJ family cysteine cluster protein n=1 Tax=Desulfospira joergensenii TaxID=53329 RepID=UPI0003B3CEEA|nr:YkgJ family cysteine cluster protein [Desulfospira joergensenii]
MSDPPRTTPTGEEAREMLQRQMDRLMENLFLFFETRELGLPALGMAMDQLIRTLIELPNEAACKTGCAHCCHLRVGVSIPEVLVIFSGLRAQATSQGLEYFRNRVIRTSGRGDVLDETWWRSRKTACPFLDPQNRCLIYDLRPFSCRAYHSTDVAACLEGFEAGKEMGIPCFPLYRAFTDMHSTVFIRTMARKGLASFQVGLVKALELLFRDETLIARWFNKEDVFGPARLEG